MINFILGLVIGGIVAYFFFKVFLKADTGRKEREKSLLSEQEEEKLKNLEKLKAYITKLGGKITNDQAQKFLKVSDATSERYLDELEEQGYIKQIGKTGISTYYEKV